MKLSKLVFSLLIFPMFFSTNAQDKIISIEYNVNVIEDDLMNSVPEFKTMLSDAIKKAKYYSFTLLINNLGSKFYDNPIINSEASNYSEKSIFIFLQYRGKTFVKKDTLFTQTNLLGPNIYKKQKQIVNWKITNETKMIDTYKCYKATDIYQVKNVEKTFNHPVTAWFCPDLPYKYGPNGYGNLPGLILELQVRNAVYGVKKINFYSEENFSFDELKNIKTLTQQEVDEILENRMNNGR